MVGVAFLSLFGGIFSTFGLDDSDISLFTDSSCSMAYENFLIYFRPNFNCQNRILID